MLWIYHSNINVREKSSHEIINKSSSTDTYLSLINAIKNKLCK